MECQDSPLHCVQTLASKMTLVRPLPGLGRKGRKRSSSARFQAHPLPEAEVCPPPSPPPLTVQEAASLC